MTSPDPVLPTTRRAEVVRELVGLMLLAAGFAGLVCVAWAVDPLLGSALLAVAAMLLGWRLTIKEE